MLNFKYFDCFGLFTHYKHTGVYFSRKHWILNIYKTVRSHLKIKLQQGTWAASKKTLLCSFAPRTSENLRGAVLPLLLLPASGSSDREGWFGACALANSSQKYSEGRGAEGVRKLDRKTDSDRSDRWDRRAETQSNDAGGDHFNCFLCFSHFLNASLRARILLLCKPRRCPNRHLAFSSGPPCGLHLWLLWWCSRYSPTPTHLLPPLRTKDMRPLGSDRASWRGRWFSWMSTPVVRSECSTTTSCLCSWTPRSSKMVGLTF